MTTAESGARRIRLFSASVVFPFERASSVLPTVIRVRIMAADSKLNLSMYSIVSALLPFITERVIRNRMITL